MRIISQKYVKRQVSDLIPHPQNAREGDVGAIHESIERNGFYGALVVQKSTGHVLKGNHTLRAAAHAGAKSLPVIEVDCDDETAMRILLADNRTSDLATYDTDALIAALKGVAPDLTGTGFDGDDLDALIRSTQPFDLDRLADEVGPPVPGDLDPQVSVRVPPETYAMWRSHVDTHMGDEAAAFAALLA